MEVSLSRIRNSRISSEVWGDVCRVEKSTDYWCRQRDQCTGNASATGSANSKQGSNEDIFGPLLKVPAGLESLVCNDAFDARVQKQISRVATRLTKTNRPLSGDECSESLVRASLFQRDSNHSSAMTHLMRGFKKQISECGDSPNKDESAT
ncbi:hypothetical protein CEXT_699061 [Caerostris extrusa]|uniref:Uncharacterized protein n=1 Tax=Caerostris extrusa TaxID=172846 RepID=A0AAV4VWV1_CAEEX|nr:hypothetical protein CEXT_699061 [Caerostris extrusa]